MKAKTLFLMALVAILAACNSNKDVSLKDNLRYIPKCPLSEEQREGLESIFNDNNELLKEYSDFHVVVIHSTEELKVICPDGISLPKLDFSSGSLVFSPIVLSSVNDEITNSSLYFNKTEKSYELHVEVQKCTECYDAIKHTYAYGMFAISQDELKPLNSEVQLSYK